MSALRSIDYEKPDDSSVMSLFEYWDNGVSYRNMSTPSVYLPMYRRLIVGIIVSYWGGTNARVLSIGCGCGYTELELQRAGFTVLATDSNRHAIRSAKAKGLETALLDIPKPTTLTEEHDIVYCDGVMGHLWDPANSFRTFFARLQELSRPDGLVVLSNDLSDDPMSYSLRVSADPHAQFFRPPRVYLPREIRRISFLVLQREIVFEYTRPDGRPRERQILLVSVV